MSIGKPKKNTDLDTTPPKKSIGFKKFGIEKVSDSENTQKYIYQGVAMLVSANPEVLSKITRGGDAFFC